MLRRAFSILIFFFALAALHAQVKTTHIPDRVNHRKEWDVVSWEKQRSADYQISRLLTDTSFSHFYRLGTSRQLIEVWLKDSAYSGQVISYTHTYLSQEESQKKKSEIIYNKNSLSPDTAKIIFYRFRQLDSIPDMEKIKGWETGLDGETFVIESASKENYDLKTYWTPAAQDDSVPHKKDLIDFCNFIYNDLHLYRHYLEFINTLPAGSYTDGFVNLSIARKKMKKNKK